jgi:hypothetical protein
MCQTDSAAPRGSGQPKEDVASVESEPRECRELRGSVAHARRPVIGVMRRAENLIVANPSQGQFVQISLA